LFTNYGTVEEGAGRLSYLPVWKLLPYCFYYNQLLHNYTSQYFLYMMFASTCSDTSLSSSGSFKSCTLLSYLNY